MTYVLPGDVLLYATRGSFWSWAIKVKTWSPVSHCELAGPDDTALASRDGKGVNTYYPRRERDLYAVLRPVQPLDMAAVWAWHLTVRGQKYDWWGLMRFFTLGKQSMHKQFCSEYLTRALRHGGLEPFAPGYDADLVSPGMFLASSAFSTIWQAPEKD